MRELEEVVDFAQKLGGEFVDVRFERRKVKRISVVNRQFKISLTKYVKHALLTGNMYEHLRNVVSVGNNVKL